MPVNREIFQDNFFSYEFDRAHFFIAYYFTPISRFSITNHSFTLLISDHILESIKFMQWLKERISNNNKHQFMMIKQPIKSRSFIKIIFSRKVSHILYHWMHRHKINSSMSTTTYWTYSMHKKILYN